MLPDLSVNVLIKQRGERFPTSLLIDISTGEDIKIKALSVLEYISDYSELVER